MAWRPTDYLIEGELEDTRRGRVIGWMHFTGLAERVSLDLAGKFNQDISGAKIHFYGDADMMMDRQEARDYMFNFAIQQRGYVGDITASLSPEGYIENPYIEWHSYENGRVVIELMPNQMKILRYHNQRNSLRSMINWLRALYINHLR